MSRRADPLRECNARRDFAHTPEPRGVIQKHAATALHYDVRLELDGLMLSWAVAT